ncbi:SRPBCC family protein [Micromonospora sp. NPDC051925]|uniref:SRPBCC family protein n=1 Tax=Micromonospora sp. NPDC051925 TaxID=3364288 RepID=UPI0037C6ECC8
MRYADGPGVAYEVHVEATPSRVWELVTDIHLPARLSTELQRVEWRDGADGLAMGASFVGYNSHPNVGEWRTASYVTELDQQRVFGWVVTDLDGVFAGPDGVRSTVTSPSASWRFELQAAETGTRLRQSVRIGPGRSGLSVVIDRAPEHEEQIVEFRLGELRSHIESLLNGIKTLAETPHP